MERIRTPLAKPGGRFILFDDDCAVCRRGMKFVHEHDPRRDFEFIPRRSSLANEMLERMGVGDINSVVLIDRNRAYTRSAALLGIVRRMPWPWKLLSGLAVIPSFLLDAVYDAFARNRYRWSSGYAQPHPDTQESACTCGFNRT